MPRFGSGQIFVSGPIFISSSLLSSCFKHMDQLVICLQSMAINVNMSQPDTFRNY